MSLRIIIVEDNTDFVEQLRKEISHLFPNQFKIVGTAGTINEAYELISTTPADVVLFDIELPDGNGLHLVEQLVKEEKHTFQFFFISSFDVRENLKKSYQLKSVYFVSKPLQNDELKAALSVVLENKNKTELIELVEHSFANIEEAGMTIAVEIIKNRVTSISVGQIMFIESDGYGRTQFHLQDGQKIISMRTLNHYAKLWDSHFQFIKVNKSQYVNVHYFKDMDTSQRKIILKNGHTMDISRRSIPTILKSIRLFSYTKTELVSKIQLFLQSFEKKSE